MEYRTVSVDSHLEVSPDRWRDFVDPEFRSAVPEVVQLDDGGDAWKMPGDGPVVPLGLNFSAGRGWENLYSSFHMVEPKKKKTSAKCAIKNTIKRFRP